MGAHMCAWCNCDPCKCKPGESRHNTVKMKNCKDPESKPGTKPLFPTPDDPLLSQATIDAFLKGTTGEEFRDPQTVPSILDTPCGSCGQVNCDCVYKDSWFGHLADGDMDKVTLAAQMEDLGDPYRRMAKCVVICDAANIDLPKWCKEELLNWARNEVGNKERYMASA